VTLLRESLDTRGGPAQFTRELSLCDRGQRHEWHHRSKRDSLSDVLILEARCGVQGLHRMKHVSAAGGDIKQADQDVHVVLWFRVLNILVPEPQDCTESFDL
jgi:hypothetical protein